ncbi:MAG: hypothetical protein Q4F41_01240 [Eubacteriales bacterium]|nr:hypothetical protein [Eubacteriales bacterium]
MPVYKMSDYQIAPDKTRDQTRKLQKFLNGLSSKKDCILQFEPGEYHFYPDYASERVLYISDHHEDVPKRCIFLLEGFENLLVDGNGAQFLFHMDCIPVYITKCRQVTVTNLSIDYAESGYSEGIIEKAAPKEMIVRIDREKYPFRIEKQTLYFREGRGERMLEAWMEFDAHTRAPLKQGKEFLVDQSRDAAKIACEMLDDDSISIFRTDGGSFLKNSQPGNILVMRHHPRSHPAFYVTDSDGVCLEQVQCHKTTGIAFLAEWTKNILLENFDVCRLEDGPVFTAAADAAHFVHCGGRLEIGNCLFENQLHHAVNIHGIYAKIVDVPDSRTLLVKLQNEMQKGIRMAHEGEEMAVVQTSDLSETARGTVVSCQFLNSDYQEIVFAEELPPVWIGDVVENVSCVPEVRIHDCVFRNNRGKGLLLNGKGTTVVERNLFETPGAAILLAGDAKRWFESGDAEEVRICKNRFERCGYVADWGKGVIQSSPCFQEGETGFYHKKVYISENFFAGNGMPVLWMEHVGKVEFWENEMDEEGDASVVLKDVGAFESDRMGD